MEVQEYTSITPQDVPADRVNAKYAPRPSIQEHFEGYHATNPEVYETLVILARQAKAKGLPFIGIDLLWARIRWFAQVETLSNGKVKYRFPNDYRSRYARLIMEKEADLMGFFKTRYLRTK